VKRTGSIIRNQPKKKKEKDEKGCDVTETRYLMSFKKGIFTYPDLRGAKEGKEEAESPCQTGSREGFCEFLGVFEKRGHLFQGGKKKKKRGGRGGAGSARGR